MPPQLIFASDTSSRKAYLLVTSLQQKLVKSISELSASTPIAQFEEITWLRDQGRHGGGTRASSVANHPLLHTGSVNVSQVHYEDDPSKPLLCATALSAIIHPRYPQMPSIHTHISYTKLRNGTGTWRIMADLNPAIENPKDRELFAASLKVTAGPLFAVGCELGDRYFYIPALRRHRGAIHFYLENFTSKTGSDGVEFDDSFPQRFGESVIAVYKKILQQHLEALHQEGNNSIELAPIVETNAQLHYHTLYFFQVLTLDRGTTSGLLVHDQNDVGILGSLPPKIDRSLLMKWQLLVPKPQDELVGALVNAINGNGEIDVPAKLRLAKVVREFYQRHPGAVALQAASPAAAAAHLNHSGPT